MAIDNKYGKIDIAGIPDDEPVFVLRAQDKNSVGAIQRYYNTHDSIEDDGARPDEDWFEALDGVIETFANWQAKNADKVKVAD